MALNSCSINYRDSSSVTATLSFNYNASGWKVRITTKASTSFTNPVIDNAIYAQTQTVDIVINGAVDGKLSATFAVSILQGGIWSTWSNVMFATNEVEPSGFEDNYSAIITPKFQDQWVYNTNSGGWDGQVGGCLANTLSTAMETMIYKIIGIQIPFSTGWIYGNRTVDPPDNNNAGLDLISTLDKLKVDGVPSYWDLNHGSRPNYLPDNYYYFNWSGDIGAKTLVSNNYNNVIAKARFNRLDSYTLYQPSMSQINYIKQAIKDYGCALMILNVTQVSGQFYSLSSTGIVPQPDYLDNYNHSMVIMGWKHINGQGYWICRNSWDDTWGDAGWCYVPMNYVATEQYVVLKPVYAYWIYWGLNALIGQTFSSVVTANYWNQFIDYIKNIYIIKNMNYDTLLGSFQPSYVTSAQQLTATNYNNLIYACSKIASLSYMGLAYVNSGDVVLASHFTKLEKINHGVNSW